MAIVRTIEVAHGDDYCVINETDFDPKVHTRYTKGRTTAKAEKKKKDTKFAEKVVTVRVAEAVQMIAKSEDRPALEHLAEHAERKTIRRAASRRLVELG